jgi:hypothetical protein
MDNCAATAYRQQIRVRWNRETHTLASLTGSTGGIRKAMVIASGPRPIDGLMSTIVGELTRQEEDRRPKTRALHAWEMRRATSPYSCVPYLLAHSPVRFPSSLIVTTRPAPEMGLALRTTENVVPDTVPSTRVNAWGPSMS